MGKQFEKGNPGKPKGEVNKTTQKIKDAYAKLLEDNLHTLQEDLLLLELNFILSLSEYILPKLARVEAEHEIKDSSVNLFIHPVSAKKTDPNGPKSDLSEVRQMSRDNAS